MSDYSPPFTRELIIDALRPHRAEIVEADEWRPLADHVLGLMYIAVRECIQALRPDYPDAVMALKRRVGDPDGPLKSARCDHGVTFDAEEARGLSVDEVRGRWPRLGGPCPKGCGYTGIYYASWAHYVCGDW
jgi:hypothetical protein